MKKTRAKNVCECGRKLKKVFEECSACGGEEFYECPDWVTCGKVYDLNGKEI